MASYVSREVSIDVEGVLCFVCWHLFYYFGAFRRVAGCLLRVTPVGTAGPWCPRNVPCRSALCRLLSLCARGVSMFRLIVSSLFLRGRGRSILRGRARR